jgi:predicted DNA-binding protein (MmcQ/YjbR family)
MNLSALRDYCLSFPGATENVQWGHDLCFKVGGKMFTVASLDPEPMGVSVKCTPAEFAELVELEDVKPADYVARYHWVTLLAWNALPDREIRRLVRQSYDLVCDKLPKARKPTAAAGARTRTRRTRKPA